MSSCPKCGASDLYWSPEHKIRIKGGYVDGLVQEVCFKCGYEGVPYTPKTINEGRQVIILNGKDRPQRMPEKTFVKDEEFTVTAVKGDIKMTLSCGPDGQQKVLSKLLSIFMEV